MKFIVFARFWFIHHLIYKFHLNLNLIFFFIHYLNIYDKFFFLFICCCVLICEHTFFLKIKRFI